ncbi:MAG: ABC transporter ATP-binding protein [bacterium]
MKILPTAFKYLKRYPLPSAAILSLSIAAASFEGAGFGMLIPLVQSMVSAGSGMSVKIPLAGDLTRFLPANQAQRISFLLLSLFFILALKNVFVYFFHVSVSKLKYRFVRDLKVGLLNNVIEYDLKFFDSFKTGHFMAAINRETARMGEFMGQALNLAALSVRIAAYAVLLFLISWKTSLVVFALAAVILSPLELMMKKLEALGARISQAAAEGNFRLSEIINGIRLIKGSGREELEKKAFQAATEEVFRSTCTSGKYMAVFGPLSETSIFGLIVLISLFLINVKKMDIGNVFPFIATYLFVFSKTLSQLNLFNSHRSQAVNNLAAFERYERFYDKKDKKTIKSGDKIIDKFNEAIEFNNVSFSYVCDRPVLTDIRLRIPRGKITAFVGISGVGKSTLVNLIMRFYDVDSGSITIDGINLKALNLNGWRKKIGFVSQDIFIFNMSVKDNISYGHAGIEDRKIIEAAEAAGAHDFTMNMPDGYDTVLGERGVRLSGGQKQRISIARAIIHDPEILILDEATSSLDTETEKMIKSAVERLAKGRTVIAIAHRLSTVVDADNIIVLDKGKIAEDGTHQELITKNGLYKRLYEAQFNMQALKL